METVSSIASAVGGYLLGSIPTGYLVARSRGLDIRSLGSGNIGATNVFRFLGKKAGILVLVVDALKGFLACHLVAPFAYSLFQGRLPDLSARESHCIAAGLGAILGHNYTCWLRFKGGKGIATSAGVLLALVPWALVVILSIWVLLFTLTRYVSLASISAAFALPFAVWLTQGSARLIWITAGVGALAIYKHRANIRRLLKGTEPRFVRKSQGTQATQ